MKVWHKLAFSDGHGSVRFVVRLDDKCFFFQPKLFIGSKRQHLTLGVRESSTMDSGHPWQELGTPSNGNIQHAAAVEGRSNEIFVI